MDRARQVYEEMQAAGAMRGPLEAPPHYAQQAPGNANPAACPPAPSPRFPGYLDSFGRKLQQVRHPNLCRTGGVMGRSLRRTHDSQSIRRAREGCRFQGCRTKVKMLPA